MNKKERASQGIRSDYADGNSARRRAGVVGAVFPDGVVDSTAQEHHLIRAHLQENHRALVPGRQGRGRLERGCK